MKIIIIGATGLIGRAAASALAARHHDIIDASRTSPTHPVDIDDAASLTRLFAAVGRFDALLVIAGTAAYRPLTELTDADFALSLASKLMGQVNAARLALPHLADDGSIALTSGIYASEPPPAAAAAAMVNAGINGFVHGAATELPRGIRINAVSPPGVAPLSFNAARSAIQTMPAADVALAYVAAVEGGMTGAIIDTRPFARR
jgi:NAD(P)-dependent dehydrogenase (short-subunit alcohol dehydrogenase family)